MKYSEKILWIVLLLGFSFLSQSSADIYADLPNNFTCHQEYACSSDHTSPFIMGNQYIYSYSVSSLLKIKSVNLKPIQEKSGDNKTITKSGLLVLLPINKCEIIVTLRSTAENKEQSSLKVVFANGTIKRVCSSQSDTTHDNINTLKALVTMLLPRTSQNDEVLTQESSQGTCLTKYAHCNGDNASIIKFQSRKYCDDDNKLAQNIQTKIVDFQETVAKFPNCEISSFGNVYAMPKELTVYSIKTSNEIVSQVKCLESLEVNPFPFPLINGNYYSSVNLQLEEIKPRNEKISEFNFYTTSISQVHSAKKSREVLSFINFQNVLEAIENSTMSDINTFDYESLQNFNRLKVLLKTSTEFDNLNQFIDFVSSASPKQTNLILKILATEANNEHVSKLLQNFMSTSSIISKLSNWESEQIIIVIMTSIQAAKPSIEMLRLSEFVINQSTNLSQTVQFNALITYSIILNKFCTKMELVTGQKYCLETSLIKNPPIITMSYKAQSTLESIKILEAVNIFQHHSYSSNACLNYYNSEKNNKVLGLWTVINCHRATPCSKNRKQFLREICLNQNHTSNHRIAAFLAMQKCFDNDDLALIKELFEASAMPNDELLTFIRGYTTNRKANNLHDSVLSILPEESAIVVFQNQTQSTNKRTTASNTISVFKIPYLPMGFHLETNMLYFDMPASVPQLITVSLSANLETGIVDIFEVEIYANDLRNSDTEIDFTITVILRELGRAVYVHEIPLSRKNILQILAKIQEYYQNMDKNIGIIISKLDEFLTDVLKMGWIGFFPMFRGHTFHSTISGIPFQLSWNVETITGLQGRATSDASSNTADYIKFKPELNLNGELSLKFGSRLEKVYRLEGSLNVMLPIQLEFLEFSHKAGNTYKLILPSVTNASIVRVMADFKEIDGNSSTNLHNWTFGLGYKGVVYDNIFANESMPVMEISLCRNSSGKIIQVKDVTYQATLEFNKTETQHYNVKASLNSNSENYEMQVGYQNTQDPRNISFVFTNNEDTEYSLNTYFFQKSREYNESQESNNEEELCTLTYDETCEPEYYLGASVSTPKWKKNFFKAEYFPRKKMDLELKLERLPIVGGIYFKVSGALEQPSTSNIYNLKVRDVLEQKIRNTFTTALDNNSMSFEQPYDLETTSLNLNMAADKLGQISASVAYIYLTQYDLHYYQSNLFAGEITYPNWSKRKQESISTAFVSIYLPNAGDFTKEFNFRTSQFSNLNIDASMNYRKLGNDSMGKYELVMRPMNLFKENFTFEVYNYENEVGEEEEEEQTSFSIESLFFGNTNFYINQTYKLILPQVFSINTMKGNVALNRTFGIFHIASLEIFVGAGTTLELKYKLLPKPQIAFEILISASAAGESYRLHHYMKPNQNFGLQDGSSSSENNDNKCLKYSGTYAFGQQSVKATGDFHCKTGNEILPFPKFNIHIDSDNDNGKEIRLFGAETVENGTLHNFVVAITKENTSIFETACKFNTSEVGSFTLKAYIKEYGELIISDSSNLTKQQNFKVNAKWFPGKQTLEGRVGFPTSLADVPLYLDFEAMIRDEVDKENKLLQVNSSSSLNVTGFKIDSKNIVQFKSSKWQFGFNAESIENQDKKSLSGYFMLPDLEKYAVEMLSLKHSYNYIHLKYNLKLQRPNVTPFHLLAELHLQDEQHEFKTTYYNHSVKLIGCHKDNFFFIFPMVTLDINLNAQLDLKEKKLKDLTTGYDLELHWGKVVCQSAGTNQLAFCNLLNAEFKLENRNPKPLDWSEPEELTLDILNLQNNFVDRLTIKLTRVGIIATSYNQTDDNDGVLFNYLSTVRDDQVIRISYTLEYHILRKFKSGLNKQHINPVNIQGIYSFKQFFESLDNFEFTDNHKWNSIYGSGLQIWSNILMHKANATTQIPSEVATFSSKYASLNPRSEHVSKNITWMEFKCSWTINGFGTIQSLVKQPSLLLSNSDGDFEVDILVKTEFTPVKIFAVTTSHQQRRKYDNDESVAKLQAFTKFDAFINDAELSTANSLTIMNGNRIDRFAAGNSFSGKFGSSDIHQYISLKMFGLLRISLGHLDVSTTLTNAEDKKTDVRIVTDLACFEPSDGCVIPTVIRFAIVENSTDMDFERNTSILIHRTIAGSKTSQSISTRLPINVISDNLDQTSFTSISMQNIATKIIDSYFNSTGLDRQVGKYQDWNDYHFELRSRYILLLNSSNLSFNLKWFGFEDNSYHCNSVLDKCYELEDNLTEFRIDTSNYCNLLLFPAKPTLFALLTKG